MKFPNLQKRLYYTRTDLTKYRPRIHQQRKKKIEKSPTTPTNLNSTTEDLRLHTPPLDIIDDDVNEQFNGEQTSPPLLSHEYLNNFNFSVKYDTLQGSPPIINFINNNQSYKSGNTIDDAIEID